MTADASWQPGQSDAVEQLSDDVIDKIAAGEVIERPASVAKELVENALDARASLVHVHLDNGGLDQLVVVDDGHGMTARDLKMAVERHATSKLRRAEDLFALRTLGFRGEALSSIAAVSRLQITTRRPEAEAGTRLTVDGGTVRECAEVGAPVGTTVSVSDLFYNTLPRRQFMRAPATEQSHVVDAVLRAVLGARRGEAVVTTGQRRLLDIGAGGDEATRVKTALGRKVKAVFPFAASGDGIRVSGYAAAPDSHRGDTKGLWFFVNGRAVRHRMLQRAVLDAFQGIVPGGRHPIVLVYIDVLATRVDVNVHPQKQEVRFHDSASIFRVLSAALARLIAEAPWDAPAAPRHAQPTAHPQTPPGAVQSAAGGAQAGVTQSPRRPQTAATTAAAGSGRRAEAGLAFRRLDLDRLPDWDSPSASEHAQAARSPVAPPDSARGAEPAAASEPAAGAAKASARDATFATPPAAGHGEAGAPRTAAPSDAVATEQPGGGAVVQDAHSAPTWPLGEVSGPWTRMRPLGALNTRFVVCRDGNGLVLLDVRGVLRRAASRRLVQQMQAGRATETSSLLLPEVVELTAEEVRLLQTHGERLEHLGFELEPVGPRRHALRALPEPLRSASGRAVLRALWGALAADVSDIELLTRCAECLETPDAADLWPALWAAAQILDRLPPTAAEQSRPAPYQSWNEAALQRLFGTQR